MLRMKLTLSLVLTSVLGALATAPAWAALGGDVASVQADGVSMKAAVRVTAASTYSIHELPSTSGTSVKEFVGADGKVFALSWQGPFMPDLRQLLGEYFPQYSAAAAATPGSHRSLRVNQPGLVVQSSGRMRAFSGRAWIPGMLPQNFAVADIH
jgi:Protein of unknown function (DUF2844)